MFIDISWEDQEGRLCAAHELAAPVHENSVARIGPIQVQDFVQAWLILEYVASKAALKYNLKAYAKGKVPKVFSGWPYSRMQTNDIMIVNHVQEQVNLISPKYEPDESSRKVEAQPPSVRISQITKSTVHRVSLDIARTKC